jgi:hypothetical protein
MVGDVHHAGLARGLDVQVLQQQLGIEVANRALTLRLLASLSDGGGVLDDPQPVDHLQRHLGAAHESTWVAM